MKPKASHNERVDDTERSAGVQSPSTFDKKIVTKVDWVVMPILLSLYLVSFLDRSNIGNANVAGLSEDLHLSDGQYEWLLTIFYIPYIVFEWFAIMWKVVPPHIWAASMVALWGSAASLQAATFNWSGMMACRFFMAIGECGFGPGVPYFLSFFYTKHELGFRIGLFYSMAPFGTMFAGALAYAITSGHTTIASWRVLFLVEGLPSLILIVVAYFFLPDSPYKIQSLTEEEKAICQNRSIRQVGEGNEVRFQGIVWRDIFKAVTYAPNWILAITYFSANVAYASLPVFTPTVLEGMGYTSVNAQGLSAPPYFVAFLLCLVSTWLADRYQQRGLIIIGLASIGGAGFILLATVETIGVRYLGIFLAAGGAFPVAANVVCWQLSNQRSDTQRGASVALLNIVGQCGPLLGTRLYPADEGPRYIKGTSVCAGFAFLIVLLALCLRTYFQWSNHRLQQAARVNENFFGMDEGQNYAAHSPEEYKHTL